MKLKVFIIIILMLIINTAALSAANYGGDLKIKVELRPLNLNPIYAANETELMINKQIFDTLVVYNNQGEVTANLAESWEINSESTLFKFKLKKGVYFHPFKIKNKELPLREREVTAEDWKWSLEYLAAFQNKSAQAELLDKIKGFTEYRQGKNDEITGIRVKDKYQLEIELKKPYAPFIHKLTRAAAAVMPAEAVKNRELIFSAEPIGTGPFKFNTLSKNRVTLLKNNNYWKNDYQKEIEPYLEKIEINFAATNNLTENLSYFDLYQLDAEEINTYHKLKNSLTNYQLQNLLQNNLYFVGINYMSENNKKISPNDLQKNLSSFLYKAENTKKLDIKNYVLPADNSNKNSILPYLSSDLQKNIEFNQLSKELVLAINDSKTNIETAEQIKRVLAAENISLEINNYSWAEFFNKLKSRNINADLFIFSADYNNSFEFIYNNLYSKSSQNYFSYQNKRLDNLIDYLKLVNSEETNKQAFEIIKEIIVNDSPFVFLLQGADYYLLSNTLSNLDIFQNHYQKYDFEKIYLNK